MRVLRRRTDNYVQFGSFAVFSLLIALIYRSPAGFFTAALFAVLAVRTLRSGLYIEEDAGLTVRNTFGTHRVPWDDYARVDVGMAGVIAIAAVLVRRKSGKDVALWCLQPPGRGKRGVPRQVTVLKEVQQAIRAVRPDHVDEP